MKESFKITASFPVTPEEIYNAWMDSHQHGEMTGGEAKVEPVVKGKFSAWDDYIAGINVELVPGQKIVQKWRTTDFPEDSPDSLVEVTLAKTESGTKLSLYHRNIPEGHSNEYKIGWKEYYFQPMKEYFSKK